MCYNSKGVDDVFMVASSHLFRNVWAILYMVNSLLLSQVIVKVPVPSACRSFRRGHPSEVQPVILLLRIPWGYAERKCVCP
jgi:hypothetical protein